MKRAATILPLAGLLMLADMDPAPAENRRFGMWELVCPPVAGSQSAAPTQQPHEDDASGRAAGRPEPGAQDGAGQNCRLQQAQAVNGGRDVVFLFNVVMQNAAAVAIVSTPLGVYLPTGLELKIDGRKPKRAAFETCNLSGCHAGFALAGTLLKALSSGNELVVTLKDTKATTVPVKVSLKGFAPGLRALAAADKPKPAQSRGG